MISLHVKFQPSSTPPSDRFWWGVLVLLVLLVLLLVLVLLVTGVKQSQLLVLRLSLEFDKRKKRRGRKEKNGVFSGHYVIASSLPPERRPPERRTLVPKSKVKR